jgi:phage terminase Nu1 subunit (DNA packaging protein)
MAENAKGKKPELPVHVTSTILARLFGLSARRVQQLTQDGIIETVQTSGGARRYELEPSVRAYVQYLRDRADGRAEKNSAATKEDQKLDAEIDLKRSKARMAQLELEELEGQMHRAEDVEAMTTDLVLAIRSMLTALPGQLAVDVANVGTAAEAAEVIKAAVYNILGELAAYKYDPKEYRRRVRDRQGWQERHGLEDDE